MGRGEKSLVVQASQMTAKGISLFKIHGAEINPREERELLKLKDIISLRTNGNKLSINYI